ncbi:MAG: cytochrome c-type biogenesis protein [Bauldia sp.]
MSRRRLGLLAALALLAAPALAVEPNEMLKDPAQEARARALSAGLRCLVCQNESIDDSHADLAHDIRVLLRERIARGDTDEQAIDYLVSRYGDFVLLKPRFSAKTLLLWGTPILVLVLGAGLIFAARHRRGQTETAPLSADEQAALRKVLDDRA